jgi:hypothetical protein
VLFFRNWDGAAPIVGNYRFIGEPGASLLYDELRRVARRYIRDDRAENKLQTMALVNEVYLRLLDVKNVDCKLVELRYFGGLTERGLQKF